MRSSYHCCGLFEADRPGVFVVTINYRQRVLKSSSIGETSWGKAPTLDKGAGVGANIANENTKNTVSIALDISKMTCELTGLEWKND